MTQTDIIADKALSAIWKSVSFRRYLMGDWSCQAHVHTSDNLCEAKNLRTFPTHSSKTDFFFDFFVREFVDCWLAGMMATSQYKRLLRDAIWRPTTWKGAAASDTFTGIGLV